MNQNYDDLRALYRQARSDEEPTRGDKRAVRVALVGAGTAITTFHATTAAGKVLALVPGVGKVLTVGQMVLYASIGVTVGGGLATIGAVVSHRGPAVGASAAAPAHTGAASRAPARALASAMPYEATRAIPLVSNSAAAEPSPSAPPAVRAASQPLRESAPAAPANASTRQSKAEPEVIAPASASSAKPIPSLIDETRALAAVQAALAAHDGARALQLLEVQERDFASGSLGQERAAARVLALCVSGRISDANAARDHFLQAYPGSPLVRRINAACEKR